MKYLILSFTCDISISNFAQSLYDANNITKIELTFSDPNWDQTLDAYYINNMDERLLAKCYVNGVFYDSVGVKYKGNSTFDTNNLKNPLNIKLDYVIDQDYDGWYTLKLSNGKNDPSFVRETLGYEIGRKYMDASKTNYAQVYINGAYYGLFTSVESVNKKFIEEKFYSNGDNTLVKCNPIYGAQPIGGCGQGSGSQLKYIGSDTACYTPYYEMKSDYGWEELMNLCDTLTNFSTEIESVLDIDASIWMLAFNNTTVTLDSYTGPLRQNYYLFKDDNGIFRPIIWDLNGAFGGFTRINNGPGPPTTNQDLQQLDPFIRINESEWPLIDVILSNPTYQRMYMAHFRTIMEENFVNGWYSTRSQELHAIADTAYQSDPGGFYSYADFVANLTSTTGTGQGAKIGITELMDARVSYLNSHPEYVKIPPTINSINAPSNAQAFTSVNITVDVTNENNVILGYRYSVADQFTKVNMLDDGNNGDGAAGDGVYGYFLPIGASAVQYFIYTENNDAGIFSPQRADYEYYTIGVWGDLVINELSAVNGSIAADQDGEFDDWIELYNNTNNTISLDGYYLSDNSNNPTKWKFPTGTNIAANDYLIIWADKDTLQSGLHTNFKLSSSGEELLLTDANQVIIDEVIFSTQTNDITFGRYPNGIGGFDYMSPTFNAYNQDVLGVEEELEDLIATIYPNPTSTWLTINSNLPNTELVVYNLMGEIIYTGTVNSSIRIDVSSWAPGMYLIRLNRTIKKLVVR